MALVGDDCFFFLNSGCVRGSQCTFRHQPAARSTTIVCPQWLQRCCYRTNCVFRHTDDIVTRNQTPCYYESSIGVCWKPRCAFAHVRKSNGPLPLPPPPVLPLRLPVLPAMPPVLPAMPPMLPVSLGISSVAPPAPPAATLPLPNNTPVVRPEAPVIVRAEAPVIARSEAPPVVQKHVSGVSNGSTNVVPPAVVPPLTPPPALPPPPKLTEIILGTKLPPSVKEAVVPQVEQPLPIVKSEAVPAAPTPNVAITGASPAVVPPKSGTAPAAVFPKSDHFNEQVRRFKEMLAAKSSQSQKKYKNGNSDDEKSAGPYRKERQRSKKERREKEGHKSHKSRKASKEKESWSKADEEILLYGDYKDVPLDKKPKRKKHKEHKEHREYADSEPEVKVKSYEEILREKALRKLYSRRKEKFNEDFKELVNANIARRDGIPDKTDRINDGLPDKVVRKNKKYNSDGDELESSDDSKQNIEIFKRRHSKNEDYEASKESRKHAEKRIHIKDDDDIIEHHWKNNDIHDLMLKKAIIDSESRQTKLSKKHREKHRERIEDDEVDLIEVDSPESSPKDENEQCESSATEDTEEDSSEDSSDETDSDSDSESSVDEVESKKEEIIIPDETTNIDFSVDLDDALAMEINQGEPTENSSKTKKMSSVVIPMNASSSDKSKYHKKTEWDVGPEYKSSSSRYHKLSDAKSTDRDNTKCDSKKSNDREQRRKSPKDLSNKHEKSAENKKVVRLVNTTEQPIVQGRISPSLNPVKDVNTTDVKSNVKNIKVKTFEEIMAEKQKRNNRNPIHFVGDSPDVVPITDSPIVAKSLNATLKEKSIQAKLEILNVSQNQNGNSVASTAGNTKSLLSKSKVLSDEEKQKRKSLQLYKPPHPAKVENTPAVKTTEVKMVVNTGPRKIIRIRKASLSTDLIDQSANGENMEVVSVIDKNDGRETVNVRSFEEIIREKRARQRRERELADQVEKENAASLETAVTTSPNNLLRRKPVIRRQVPQIIGTTAPSTCSISKTVTTVATILSNTTTTNNTDTQVNLNTVSENKRPLHTDSNIAKVSPSNVVPYKRSRSDTPTAPVVTQTESLENKDFFSRLRNTASRRLSLTSSHNTVTECERTPPVMKLRKRSVTTTVEASPISNHVPTEKLVCTIDNSVESDTLNEKKAEYHGSSREDIQEALDEERRKREQDLLSDDEFEKEINELGSDDDDNFDDMNEDDLMMELEQMIDS